MDMLAEPLPGRRADWPTRALLLIAAVDEPTLRRCPDTDRSTVRALGLLLVLQWVYLTALFSLFVHIIFAPLQPMQPIQVLIALFLSSFILAIDSFMVIRSGWYHSGIQELKKAGYDISGGRTAQIKAYAFLAIRIVLSIGIAQLSAVCLSLLIFGGDVTARVNDHFQQVNAGLIAQAREPIDQDIAAARQAITAEEARHQALASQLAAARQGLLDPLANDTAVQEARNELTRLEAQEARDETQVRQSEQFESAEMGGLKQSAGNSGRAGNGPKHRAALAQLADAKRHEAETSTALAAAHHRIDALRDAATATATPAKANEQIAAFEQALASESDQLDQLRQVYDRKLAARNAAIQHAIESAPTYVPPATGFLTQVKLLEEVAGDDAKIKTIIILIDVVSFTFELAAVLAKAFSYTPTTYASLLASEVYLSISKVGAELARKLDPTAAPEDAIADGFPLAPTQPTDGSLAEELFKDATPARRRRGRPRKNEVN